MNCKWTAQEVVDATKILPPVRDDEELWKKIWTRNVSEFGLKFYMPTPDQPYSEWDESMWADMELVDVPTHRIRFSSQTFVRLDVLDWYLQMPVWKENFDTDGWFGNNHPVLILLPSGKYVIRDGNHRIISRVICDFDFVKAYVMRGT